MLVNRPQVFLSIIFFFSKMAVSLSLDTQFSSKASPCFCLELTLVVKCS